MNVQIQNALERLEAGASTRDEYFELLKAMSQGPNSDAATMISLGLFMVAEELSGVQSAVSDAKLADVTKQIHRLEATIRELQEKENPF